MADNNKETQSLFRRLTRIFRSGPIVRRKIRGQDTTAAMPDKTKSSGALLFQKSQSPTYSSITANAYNLSERLMRYQDFQEMEYSLATFTKIATPDGFITIGELAEKCKENPDYEFIVYSYDHEKKQIVPALGKQARQTCVDDAWKITFDSGKEITASPEHRLMLRDGTYRKAEDLKVGDSLMPFYRRDLFENAQEGTKGYHWIYTMDPVHKGWTKEHQLIAEWVSGRKLGEDECVHHMNFIKTDNRPENLKVMTNSDHNSYHTSINNGVKWHIDNSEWIEKFKKNHAVYMRDNAPTRRNDITFGRILETCERVGFHVMKVCATLDVSINLVTERLVAHGFHSFDNFAKTYKPSMKETLLATNKPGLLTRDLSIDLIKRHITAQDTKRSLCIKLGCTANVFDKFLSRRVQLSWVELRECFGFPVQKNELARKGGRPKNSNKGSLTYQDICDAFEKEITLPRLSEKLKMNKNTVLSRLVQQGFQKYSDWSSSYDNHKVVSIEYVGKIPLFDLTVDGYKNFATDSVISHNTSEIASTLDIYSDETCSQDDKGQVLHVYSNNEKIKEILQDLFYNTINTEFNLRSWTRNLVKYGDMFALIDVHPDQGVVGVRPIPVNEIEREENYDPNDPFAIRYRWVTLGNRILENWEVAHFRLLGNDLFLPYGSSVIEAARRVWRQLILIEDAMLVYRVVRAPERRVFYIDIGNIPPEEVEAYMQKQKQALRNTQVVDKNTGRVDLRYNPLCFTANTKIPLLSGKTLTIQQLVNDWENGIRDHETYSIDIKAEGRVVPGKIIWAGKSGVTNQIARITLDDGQVIEVTPTHKMMRRNGEFVSACDLKPNDSLMPFYTDRADMQGKIDKNHTSKHSYERVFNPSTNCYVFTHRLVVSNNEGLEIYSNGLINQQGKTIHHKNFQKLDNSSSNLKLMTNSDHSKLHSELGKQNIIKYNKSDKKKQRVSQVNKERNSIKAMAWYNMSSLHTEHNIIRKKALDDMWADSQKREEVCDNMSYKWSIQCQQYVIEKIRTLSQFEGIEAFLRRLQCDEKFVSLYKSINEHLSRDDTKSIRKNLVGKFITRDYRDWKSVWAAHHPSALGRKFTNNVSVATQETILNHKVSCVEIIDRIEDVYNVTIDGYHTLAVTGKSENNTLSIGNNGIFCFQSVDEDYFVPVRGQDTGTKIDTLAGGQNTASVEDVAYIQKKLIAALKIPRAYLGFDEALASKSTLAQEDIRFSRTISIIQKTMLAELNKIAIIHLFAHGFENEDLQNFTLHLSNPSTVAQQQKLELWRAKFEIAGSTPEGMASKNFIRKTIWDLTDEQCKELDQERLKEKIIDATIEGSSPEGDEGGGAPSGGGGGGGGGDLFGDSGAGADTGGGEEPEAGGEEKEPTGNTENPPPETAGEKPDEDENAGVSLLTSSDDIDDDEDFALRLKNVKDPKVPLKASNSLDRALYNRSRVRNHGASKTHMPDFNKMLTPKGREITDPYDNASLKAFVTNPLEETYTPLSTDVVKMLSDVNNFLQKRRIQATTTQPKLLSETTIYDIDVEGDDDENEE